MSTAERRAAIDIGTVSTRLLIADVSDGVVVPIVRRTVVTHLGDGVAASARIAPESLERTMGVVLDHVEEARQAGVDRLSVVATSAARDAANGGEFLSRLRALGLEPEIISGQREAHLSFVGATYSLRQEDVLVADLGGGSTELVFGSVLEDAEGVKTDVEAARSVDVGSRRVTDLFLASDPPTTAEVEAAAAWVVDQVRPFFDGLKKRPRVMVVLGGTATTLAAIRLGLDEYQEAMIHETSLTGADLADLREELSSLTLDARRCVTGLDPARAEVIVGGVVLLEALLGLAGLDSVQVSEHDILYGVVLADD